MNTLSIKTNESNKFIYHFTDNNREFYFYYHLTVILLIRIEH